MLAFDFDSCPEPNLVESSLNMIARRHEVLRTKFSLSPNGEPNGLVVPSSSFRVPWKVLKEPMRGEHAELKAEHWIDAAICMEASYQFDLETDSLIRGLLLQRASGNAVLLITMHHAVSDAWSCGVLCAELSICYECAKKGLTIPDIEPLAIQYGDFAAWHREQVASPRGNEARTWWKEALSGAPAVIQLPIYRSRPSNPTYECDELVFNLPLGLLEQVEALARRLRVNIQAVLLSAFQLALLFHSGDEEVVVGVPTAGRDQPETHGLIGYFINTLPVRCSVSDSCTFEDMIRATSESTIAALAHSILPLQEIVASSPVARVPGANPLFQCLFQYLDPTRDPGAIGKLVLGQMTGRKHNHVQLKTTAKADVTAVLLGSVLYLEYMTEIYDCQTIQRLYDTFKTALTCMVDNMHANVRSTSLLSLDQSIDLAEKCMGEQRPEYFDARLVHDAFAAMAVSCPDLECLVFQDQRLTYGEAYHRVRTMAEALVSVHGVGPGVVVGVMLDRSLDLVVSILAVLTAGGCYLPCDPSYPDERLSVYVEDAGSSLLLTEPAHVDRATAMAASSGRSVGILDVTSVFASAEDGGLGAFSGDMPVAAGPEDPAYIIFTSGSTGRPKGVTVPHRGLRDFAHFIVDEYDLGASLLRRFRHSIASVALEHF